MAIVSNEKRSLFQSYASEFEEKYLRKPVGQQHLAMYRKERDEVCKYWSDIKLAKEQGKPITDMVLEKLLPYSDTPHNREKGYHISITPAITRDLKKWFQNAGWQQPDNWDNVANALYDLIYGLIENDDWHSLTIFEANQHVSKGIKAGFITPTLFCLNTKYRIINSKTIDTINYLLGYEVIGRDLTRYKEYLVTIDQALKDLAIPLLMNAETFDAFCHWMCDKRLGGYARKKIPSEPSAIVTRAPNPQPIPMLPSLEKSTKNTKGFEIFCCYAHEDEALLIKLKTHLRPLQRARLINVWHDRDISPGEEWEQEINEHLNDAQIILLLVSPDFVDSEYCYSIEMQRAIERHKKGEARVIPIILRWIDWHGTPLGGLQALPTDGKPVKSWSDLDEAFYNVAEGIRKVVKQLTEKLPSSLPLTSTFRSEEAQPNQVVNSSKQVKLKGQYYTFGEKVRHHEFGDGVVIESNLEKGTEVVTVQFQSGRKRLNLNYTNLEKL